MNDQMTAKMEVAFHSPMTKKMRESWIEFVGYFKRIMQEIISEAIDRQVSFKINGGVYFVCLE